jgi:hypothetical protein
MPENSRKRREPNVRSAFLSVAPLIPSGADFSAGLAFFVEHLGFTVVWQDEDGAGVARDGVAFNIVKNENREWARNASFSIGVSDLDRLYQEYEHVPANVGPLEPKPWGRREFHMIVPSGVCLQFYQGGEV